MINARARTNEKEFNFGKLTVALSESGNEQTWAHGLGGTPTKVEIVQANHNSSLTVCTSAEGTHTDTNVKFTPTMSGAGADFIIIAQL